MAHRDDRDALRARNEALERQLRDAHEELARAREPRSEPASPPRSGSEPPRSPRRWSARRAASLLAVAAASIALTTATASIAGDAPGELAGAALTGWIFLGQPIALWLTAERLELPHSALWSGVLGALGVLVFVLVPTTLPALHGTERALVAVVGALVSAAFSLGLARSRR